MKRMNRYFFVVVMILGMFSMTCLASASENNYREETVERCKGWISPALGDWYDTNGNLAMTIELGYINGCEIVKGYNFAGGYPRAGTFTIMESTGERDIELSMGGETKGGHQYLIIDKNTALRRTKEPQYVESIGGLYLGISKEEVQKLYGKPTSQENKYSGSSKWNYEKEGVTVDFHANVANGIVLYSNSNRHFDKSKLNGKDSFQAFYEAYGMKRMPYVAEGKYSSSGAYRIGDGEYLFFNKGSIMLSIYNN